MKNLTLVETIEFLQRYLAEHPEHANLPMVAESEGGCCWTSLKPALLVQDQYRRDSTKYGTNPHLVFPEC